MKHALALVLMICSVASSQTSSAPGPVGTQPSANPAPSNSSPATAATPASVPAKKSLPKKKTRQRAKASTPKKVVVRNGSTHEPSVQFSTTSSASQASHEKADTSGLLAATNANLQKLSGRSLNATQQDTQEQILSYVHQAKTAEDSGDLESARNLAQKAQLLSQELLRGK